MRIKPEYIQPIEIPDNLQMLFWDCPEQKTYLEKFIKRILDYGNFEEIKWCFEHYPNETFVIAFKYPDMRRGVKFWIRLWNNQRN